MRQFAEFVDSAADDLFDNGPAASGPAASSKPILYTTPHEAPAAAPAAAISTSEIDTPAPSELPAAEMAGTCPRILQI